MSQSKPFYYDEPSTLENMCPDHIRVLGGRFTMPASSAEARSEERPVRPDCVSKAGVIPHPVLVTYPDGSQRKFIGGAVEAGKAIGASPEVIRNATRRNTATKGGYFAQYA